MQKYKDCCPFGGDIENDCANCFDGVEYHYDKISGECVLRDSFNNSDILEILIEGEPYER